MEEKEESEFHRDKKSNGGLNYWCKECHRNAINDFRKMAGGAAAYRKRSADSVNKYKNSHRVNQLITSNRLDKPSTVPCSNMTCTDRAQEYHHLKYDNVDNGDNVSIITPLCRRCHNMIEDKDLGSSVQVSLKIQIECFGQGKKSHITYLGE